MISSADVMLCGGCAAFCIAIVKSHPLSQFNLVYTYTIAGHTSALLIPI